MPRSREFEPQHVLQRAMELFWRNGYEHTSVDDVVAATGASRYGLYSVFGDKRELFLAALDLYRDTVVSWLLSRVEADDASLGAIRQYFGALVASATSPEGTKGCLMCNTVAELPMHESPVVDKVASHFERMGQAFLHALANARQKGELPNTFDIEACADYLVGVAQGVFVYARSPVDRERIRRFVRYALATLP